LDGGGRSHAARGLEAFKEFAEIAAGNRAQDEYGAR
jgi:hypothetical protein